MTAYLSKLIKAQELIQMVEQLSPAGVLDEGATKENTQESAASQNRESASEPLHLVVAPSAPDATALASQASYASPLPSLTINLEQAVNQCFGQYEMFQDMVNCFYDEGETLWEQMQTAFHQQDAAEVSCLAHKLVNTVFYLGCDEVVQTLKQIEQRGKQGELAALELQTLTGQLAALREAVANHRRF